jgi:hypothetical protein
MSRIRNAPLEVRRAYQRALAALPVQSSVVFPPDLDSLTTVGTAVVGGQTLAFGILRNHPRIWITADAPEGPTLLGHLSGVVNDVPDLWICDHESWPWILSGDIADQIEEAAVRVWQECLRDCDG